MSDYKIIADTGADISQEILKRWDVDYCQLTFKFDGEETEYKNFDMDTKVFYDKMRKAVWQGHQPSIPKDLRINSKFTWIRV